MLQKKKEASDELATFHTCLNSMPCRSDTRLVLGALPYGRMMQKFALRWHPAPHVVLAKGGTCDEGADAARSAAGATR